MPAEESASRRRRARAVAGHIGVAAARIALVALVLAAAFHAAVPAIAFGWWTAAFFAVNAAWGLAAALAGVRRRSGVARRSRVEGAS